MMLEVTGLRPIGTLRVLPFWQEVSNQGKRLVEASAVAIGVELNERQYKPTSDGPLSD